MTCCDLHGRNCEPPSELCCWQCTEAQHGAWMDVRGRQRYGHPPGEECSAPDPADEVVKILTAALPAGLTAFGVAMRLGKHPPWGTVPLEEVRAAIGILRGLLAVGRIRRYGVACYALDDD